jgi:hypothetical protein
MDYPDPEYPKHVEAYLEGPYRDYLGERQAFQRLQSRLVTLKIAVANSGLATAEDVTVRVKLPHTVRPLTAEEDSVVNEGAPQEPDPPPVSRGGILDAIGLLRGTRLTASRLPSLPSIPIEASRVRGPSFKKEDGESYVFYHIAQLVPQLPERDLEPFQVLIDEKAEVDQLDLDLEFYGSNLPEPQRQRLSVRLSERLMPH